MQWRWNILNTPFTFLRFIFLHRAFFFFFFILQLCFLFHYKAEYYEKLMENIGEQLFSLLILEKCDRETKDLVLIIIYL